MRVSLLNLISTPIPVLNSLGLELAVGLSSESPSLQEKFSSSVHAYVTIYSPKGERLERRYLGEIPPRRRRLIPLSPITREIVPDGDHLVVVHRIPASMLDRAKDLDSPVEIDHKPEFPMWRALIQYSYAGKSNGSVVYETPPMMNVIKPGAPPSKTLTFSSKILLSSEVNTFVIPIHYSMDPSYSRTCKFHYMLLDPAGRLVINKRVVLNPFSVAAIDLGKDLASEIRRNVSAPELGFSNFSFVAYSDEAALVPLFVNVAPSLGGVSVEHSHPPQSFLLPSNAKDKNRFKAEAIAAWSDIARNGGQGNLHVG